MRYWCLHIVTVALLVTTISADATAQEAPSSIPSVTAPSPIDSATARATAGWSAIRVAKWSLAVASAGTAAYGFINNQRADDRYERLERVCLVEPDRCQNRMPDGTYADAELEQDYREVRALDRRARKALIAGQIGVAASVVLFILDLRDSDGPENIPYEPRSLDIAPARDGGLSLRMNVALPRH